MTSGTTAAALPQSAGAQTAATSVPTEPKYFIGTGYGPLNIATEAAYQSAYSQASAEGYPLNLCKVTEVPPPIWYPGDWYTAFVKIHCTPPPPPPAGSGPVISVANGKCVDVKDGSTKDGAPVQLYKCNGGINQLWTLEADKTVRSMGHCLDVQYAKTENGSPIGLNSCHGAGNQQFELLPGGKLRGVHSGKCVDVDNVFIMLRLVIRDCSDARPYQQFRGTPLGL
ncbi:ricin-type beta-trefoil lectin domain protein [Streptomyces sp. ISL-43]|uniref:RICIN domain-containing protein n=1 Tax=Streptomyces sp. ISL-43 TaxID=2819183 RepID=UPI001BE6A942|nr:RICIN domain-containing protein [Streptomyces sp. ISL-43]MBT2453195.1 ricin-type beta-trefoil lectin domain protein [Streptomyces sp. ISL-43]